MKRILLLLFSLLTVYSASQTKTIDTAAITSGIDKTVSEIQAATAQYEKKRFSESFEGYRDHYFKDGKAKRITICYNEGGNEKNVDWYFVYEKLVFAEKKWIETASNKTISHELIYVYQGLVVLMLQNGVPADLNQPPLNGPELSEYAEGMIRK